MNIITTISFIIISQLVYKTISYDQVSDDKDVPIILNSGFDEEGNKKYRDHWLNSSLGGPLQITSGPVHHGDKAAKFPSSSDRIAYQLIDVDKNTEYTLSFYYTMKTTPKGELKVAVLGGHITDQKQIEKASIESITLTDQSSANKFIQASLSFNSSNHDQVAIYISNKDAECRVDTFTIKKSTNDH